MDKFITSRMQGRLGNMMFQIAHTYVMSKKYNVRWAIPRHESNSIPYEQTIFRSIPFYDGKTDNLLDTVYLQLPFRYQPAPEPLDGKATVYVGWRQSEKFFEGRSNEIRDLFGPTDEFVKRAYENFPELNQGRVCAINVRRGDYLTFKDRHPVITREVILEGVKQLKQKPDTIFVLSDDLQWCKDNLADLPNVKFIDWYESDGLWLLSLCHDFIISNSTFSWWGAFLSHNTDKQIIAPSTWFGPAVLQMGDTPEDIYNEDWTIIPTVWKEDGFIHLA
jgi:hypothetical protein